MQSMTKVMSYVGDDTVLKESTPVLQPNDLLAKQSKNDLQATKVRDCRIIC